MNTVKQSGANPSLVAGARVGLSQAKPSMIGGASVGLSQARPSMMGAKPPMMGAKPSILGQRIPATIPPHSWEKRQFDAYVDGFIATCERLSVNAEQLLKHAQVTNTIRAPTPTMSSNNTVRLALPQRQPLPKRPLPAASPTNTTNLFQLARTLGITSAPPAAAKAPAKAPVRAPARRR